MWPAFLFTLASSRCTSLPLALSLSSIFFFLDGSLSEWWKGSVKTKKRVEFGLRSLPMHTHTVSTSKLSSFSRTRSLGCQGRRKEGKTRWASERLKTGCKAVCTQCVQYVYGPAQASQRCAAESDIYFLSWPTMWHVQPACKQTLSEAPRVCVLCVRVCYCMCVMEKMPVLLVCKDRPICLFFLSLCWSPPLHYTLSCLWFENINYPSSTTWNKRLKLTKSAVCWCWNGTSLVSSVRPGVRISCSRKAKSHFLLLWLQSLTNTVWVCLQLASAFL